MYPNALKISHCAVTVARYLSAFDVHIVRSD